MERGVDLAVRVLTYGGGDETLMRNAFEALCDGRNDRFCAILQAPDPVVRSPVLNWAVGFIARWALAWTAELTEHNSPEYDVEAAT